MWNKQNLISEIDQFDAALQEMRSALVANDRDKLEQMFRLSTQRRAAFDKNCPNNLNLESRRYCHAQAGRPEIQAFDPFAHP